MDALMEGMGKLKCPCWLPDSPEASRQKNTNKKYRQICLRAKKTIPTVALEAFLGIRLEIES